MSSAPFTLRPGITFNVPECARYGFEFFTTHSPEMIAEMDAFLNLAEGCSRLLDIGGYHGLFSLAFCASQEHRVAWAVEPAPGPFAGLSDCIDCNRDLTISAFIGAFSSTDGIITMGHEWEHAVVKPRWNDAGKEDMLVLAVNGDNWCHHNSFFPDIIKVDVEGHEMKVLKGLENILSDRHPKLLVELHPENLPLEGDSEEGIVQFLLSLGYKAFDLNFQPVIHAGHRHMIFIHD